METELRLVAGNRVLQGRTDILNGLPNTADAAHCGRICRRIAGCVGCTR